MKYTFGIDTRMIKKTGIGTYIRGLLEGLESLNVFPRESVCLFGAPQSHEREGVYLRRSFWSRIYSLEEQAEYLFHLPQCRLWHAPHYNVPFKKGKTKLVVTIHDLIHWIFRKDFFSPLQAFYAETMLRKAVELADHILAVSHKTRDDLIQHFNADPEKITVTYEGVSDQFAPIEDSEEIERVKSKYHLPKNFFLYVGMLKPHKNVLWLVHLFRELKQEGRVEASLLLIGKKDFKYPTGYEDLSKLKTEKGVVHLPYVEEHDLVALYNAALALIHPSLYEGFGLTLLEAMACGTPVIACRSASVPEVVGDAGYLVDSCAQKEMREAIVRFENFPNLRRDYAQKGRRHAERFRWSTMADQTARVYERVLSES